LIMRQRLHFDVEAVGEGAMFAAIKAFDRSSPTGALRVMTLKVSRLSIT
jgi:hypothetical protein